MSLESSKKSLKVPKVLSYGTMLFLQIISTNQDSKLKGTVKKRAISLTNQFLCSILQKNSWLQRGISLFCNLSGISDKGIDTLKSVGLGTSG